MADDNAQSDMPKNENGELNTIPLPNANLGNSGMGNRGGRGGMRGRGGFRGGPRGGQSGGGGYDRGATSGGGGYDRGTAGGGGGSNSSGGGRRGFNRGGGGDGRGGNMGPRRGGGGGPGMGKRPGEEYWSNNSNLDNQNDGSGASGGGGPFHGMQPRFGPGGMDKVGEKLMGMMGPTYELPPIDVAEKKFNGRSRLYIGNLHAESTEDEIKDMFAKYGETAEFFLNREKNFAFIKLDYFNNAEKAKRELDGFLMKGKNIRIRFAPSNATIKVLNLSPFVSNELLHLGFSIFGEVEKATVLMDERGKSTGEGIVEFARKGAANHAIRRCTDNCFFLTSNLRPVIVKPYESQLDTDGLQEKQLPKRNHEYMKEREVGPHFGEPNSFEEEYGNRWKQLYELYKEKEEALKSELRMESEKLEAQLEFARYEHETAMLRDQLRQRELDRERQKQEWEMKERMMEQQLRRNETDLRRKEESINQRHPPQEDDLRRQKQEDSLFLQAHKLDALMVQQELSFDQKPNVGAFANSADQGANNTATSAPGVWMNTNANAYGAQIGANPSDIKQETAAGGSRWGVQERRDDFQFKRRRF